MNGESLKGKICLVTGASRGIGAAVAEKFLSEGAVLYATERKEGDIERGWAGALSDESRARLRTVRMDVTDGPAVRETFHLVRKNEKRLDVLVNNAGVEYNEAIGMIQKEHVGHMLSVNVTGLIDVLQNAARIMMRNKSGSVINIASVVGIYGNPGQLGYAASKGAVIALTRSAAKELAGFQIRVNAVAPGMTDTEMFKKADPDALKDRISRIGLGRIASPEDVANACLFLASDASSYISGQVLGVDGCSVM